MDMILFVAIYLVIGVALAVRRLRQGVMGTSGPTATFIVVTLAWPVVALMSPRRSIVALRRRKPDVESLAEAIMRQSVATWDLCEPLALEIGADNERRGGSGIHMGQFMMYMAAANTHFCLLSNYGGERRGLEKALGRWQERCIALSASALDVPVKEFEAKCSDLNDFRPALLPLSELTSESQPSEEAKEAFFEGFLKSCYQDPRGVIDNADMWQKHRDRFIRAMLAAYAQYCAADH